VKIGCDNQIEAKQILGCRNILYYTQNPLSVLRRALPHLPQCRMVGCEHNRKNCVTAADALETAKTGALAGSLADILHSPRGLGRRYSSVHRQRFTAEDVTLASVRQFFDLARRSVRLISDLRHVC
jgi:hypothetical protein